MQGCTVVMSQDFSSYSLGATLYMPIVHPKVPAFLRNDLPFPAPSVVLCLEDALAENDVARGVALLKDLLHTCPRSSNTRVFVRPRSLDMARRLADLSGIENIEGFVAPKVVPATAPDWMTLGQQTGLKIMPTVEHAEFFDPARIVALRDAFDAHDRGMLSAIRLGGNDLLGAMALRRQSGITSWEGPLAWILSMASSILISSGYSVAAPVYDIIEDIETLRRELRQDVAAGFVSKTAIHPAQVPFIHEAFQVSPADLEQASAILDDSARAVFQIGGVMCEPSTHRPWAERILARARVFGITGEREADARRKATG